MGEHLDSLCIRVPKVYDWVKREISLERLYSNGSLEFGNFDPTSPYVDVEVILTDAAGNPLDLNDEDAIAEVIEIPTCKKHGRKHKEILLPDGEVVTLHEVKLSMNGFCRIKFTRDEFGCEDLGTPGCYLSPVVPWSTTQRFYLCAPEGTYPVVRLDNFDGQGDVRSLPTGGFESLDLEIMLCVSVQVERYVNIEVEGSYCHPRPELLETLGCGPIIHPPQCHELFPGTHHLHEEDHGGEYEFE
ncbi:MULTISPECIES: hypothetical protein [Bacillaceae]|uniref:hypothetical protein n=1 Tax=Bacillaceae TaxID=186817 RepID=UPI00104E854E|nr:hypothetical protein [Bacillus sp. CBEL-1]TDB53186.1 hypothetical protein EPL02_06720 [Bacillus sp. CBEL-1]